MVTALWGLRSHRPQGAIPMTLSYAVLAATGVNDVVRGFGSPGGVNLVPIGTLVFALMQSFVVAARLTAAFRSVEALSHDLEVSNRELERKDKLKDDFLAMTSHDLRTPLHGMIGIAESLTLGAGGRLPVEVRDDLLLIAGSGRRLSILVDDILDLARLKHSDIRLEPKPVHSRGMVQTVLDTLQPLARRKSIELRNEVRDDLAPMMADEGRIYRVLYNLLGNAITHTSQGTIRVKGESRGGFMEISVADEGRGIAPEQLERIFEAYEQAGEGANERSGAGLGLAIARRLAELHGGALSVSSEVGIGSTFTLRVPVAADAPDAVAAPLRPAPDEAPLAPTLPPAVDSNSAVALRPRGKSVTGRVLVVDDEAVNVQVVANQLKLHGMEVRTASNGQDALRALHCDNPPEVVLLDVMMPGMNGLDVCRAIRQTRSMSELPVVLLTALQRREDVMRGFEAGANDYLCKPFHSEELVARVRGQLSVRKAFAMQGEKANLEKQVEDGRLAEARARLEAERATLETLRYQLNPHFLLNALASIRGAIVEAPDVARRAVSDLSAFCQLTLQRAPRTTVTVQEELEMIRLFLDLHRTRWGDYLRASTEFDESILNSSIPAWLLQPIVENALKHGSRTSPDALEVRVSGRRTSDGRLAFVVSNTGRYLAEQSRGGDGGLRVGFENIRKRLERTHPSAHTVAVRTETGWVHVELALSELTLRTEEPGQTEGHESRIET